MFFFVFFVLKWGFWAGGEKGGALVVKRKKLTFSPLAWWNAHQGEDCILIELTNRAVRAVGAVNKHGPGTELKKITLRPSSGAPR